MQQILLDGTPQQAAKPKTAKPQQTPAAKQQQKILDAKTTTVYDYRIPAATNFETSFRHSHWKIKRAKVLAALTAAGQSQFAIDRFIQCGSDATVEWNEEEKRWRVVCNTCKNRHCEPCQKARASKLAGNLRDRLAEKPDGKYWFVTLTLKHSTDPLADQLKRLNEAYKKLRKTREWKENWKGGATIIEVKWNPENREWHPHMHVITEGGYVKWGQLREDWIAITGDSSIVHIKSLDNARNAAHYVSKYVTKGTSSEVWNDPEAAAEWIIATKGLRVCGTFGTWRGYKLMANPKSTGTWKVVERLDALMTRVAAGSISALNLYYALPGPQHEDPPDS
ncbi:MAG TPA: protein rep [Terracidiphilus sp.]|nr:protein rep [Terracidiphilus sp.]